MPEDVTDVTVSEQTPETTPEEEVVETAQDELAAFNEDTEEDKAEAQGLDFEEVQGEPEEEPEPEPEKKPKEEGGEPETPESEKTGEEAAPEKQEGETPAEKSARERAESRAKEIAEAQPQGRRELEPPPEQKKELPPEQPAKDQGGVTKEKIQGYLNNISIEDLPEGEIIIGNDSVNLKEFAQEEPDMFNAVRVMAGMIADKRMQDAKPAQQDNVDVQGIVSNLLDHNEQLSFEMQMTELHPGWRPKAASQEWKDWLASKPESIRRLSESRNPEDAVAILEYFDEESASAQKASAAEKVVEYDGRQAKAKAKVDAIHSTTVRNKGPARQESAMTPREQELDGFYSEDDDDDLY